MRGIYPIAPNGIFWTLQGEGVLTGEPMVFVRLAGCSVGCAGCDTNYAVSERLDIETILKRVAAVVPSGFWSPWVWITGGEPTDHDLQPLCDALRPVHKVALATSGVRTVPPSLVAWLSVSPHANDDTWVHRYGHELKVVPGLGALCFDDLPDMLRSSFAYKFLQPFDGPNGTNVDECVAYTLAHPGWRLTSQSHKAWQLP